MGPEKTYVMRQVDGLIYFVSNSIAEDFDEWTARGDRGNGLRYVADVVIDAETRQVIKSRYF